jgi:predicted transcriptional regulator
MPHAVSVRLDDEVIRALNTLEASGMSRSEASRKAILDAAAALRRKVARWAEMAVPDVDEESGEARLGGI